VDATPISSMAAATGIPACSMARIMRRPTCPKDRPSADHRPFQVTP
jgi:saccharopine dehydrogenase-like NADP-dependent oxidoreductase